MTNPYSTITYDDYLEHYGIKGMKWGVRRKEGPDGRVSTKRDNSSAGSKLTKNQEDELTDVYKNIPDEKVSKKQQYKNLAENQEKFLAKAGLDGVEDDSSKGWRPTKKQVAAVVIGAAAVGAVAYGGYKVHQHQVEKKRLLDIEKKHRLDIRNGKHPPGTKIDAADYTLTVAGSKSRTWTKQNYLKDSSFDQDDFTLPKGHTFTRISSNAETDFRRSTYATSNEGDYNRYLTAFRGEATMGSQKLYKVSFSANEDIKVPSLTKRLEAMRTVLTKANGGVDVGPEAAKRTYTSYSGGYWDNDTAKSFFKELGSQGYSDIVDDMDAGVIGEAPLVIFRPDAMGKKTSKLITPDDITHAENNLTEIRNRK